MKELKEKTNYCTNCGKIITDDSNYCHHCGKEITSSEKESQKDTIKERNNTNTDLTNNDLSFKVDENKLSQIFKAIEKQGKYFNNYGSKMIWVAVLIVALGVFLPGFFLLLSADSMDNPIDISPIALIIIIIAFAGIIIWVSVIRLRQQKYDYLGKNPKVWIKNNWILYMHTYDTSGMNEYRVNYSTDAVLVNLKQPTTKISYNSETNIIDLTGFLIHTSVINNQIYYNDTFDVSIKEHDFLTKLTNYLESQNISYNDKSRIKNIEIPNCFNPDLYEYLKKNIEE